MTNTAQLGSYGDVTGAPLVFRNKLINGGFDIWQLLKQTLRSAQPHELPVILSGEQLRFQSQEYRQGEITVGQLLALTRCYTLLIMFV